MTTSDTVANNRVSTRPFKMPDPPERRPEEMSSFNHLNVTGGAYLLAEHLGNPDTTLVAGEHYISTEPVRSMAGLRYPDLLVAFGVDPAAYYRSNAYIISEQGKPPDFVLEIASPSTARIDTTEKRDDYAALGIAEYWRFDETGQRHGTRLAGDRLADGRYEAITIRDLGDGVLEGFSEALNLNIRWENGRLGWHDPATGEHIATLRSERAAKMEAEAVAEAERAAKMEAEARVRELEAELRRSASD